MSKREIRKLDGKNTVGNAKPRLWKSNPMHIKKASKCKTTICFKDWLNLVTEYIGESDSSIRMETFLGSNFKQFKNYNYVNKSVKN